MVEFEKMTREQKIEYLNAQIEERRAHWQDIHDNGCSDPFWADGLNMNLVRNHVIYYLKQLKELSQEPTQMSLFAMVDITPIDEENDPRIPPKVADSYMAKERKCFYFDHRRSDGSDDGSGS